MGCVSLLFIIYSLNWDIGHMGHGTDYTTLVGKERLPTLFGFGFCMRGGFYQAVLTLVNLVI